MLRYLYGINASNMLRYLYGINASNMLRYLYGINASNMLRYLYGINGEQACEGDGCLPGAPSNFSSGCQGLMQNSTPGTVPGNAHDPYPNTNAVT